MDDLGKITAMCISQRDRVGLCARAVDSFCRQTYPNKQLLVFAEDKAHADALVAAYGFRPGVATLSCPEDVRTPARRFQLALNALPATLPLFFTFWDDDNESHPDRLARQISPCYPGIPSFLSGSMWHFFDPHELFVLEFEERGQFLWDRIVPISMVCSYHDLAGIQTEKAFRRTKNPGAGLARVIYDKFKDKVARVIGEPWWLKIGVRGDNAEGYEHHRRYTQSKKCFRRELLRDRRVWFDRFLADYGWDDAVDVCGVDGAAYTFEPTVKRLNMPPIGQPVGIEKVVEET